MKSVVNGKEAPTCVHFRHTKDVKGVGRKEIQDLSIFRMG